jgi:hypothetical protein
MRFSFPGNGIWARFCGTTFAPHALGDGDLTALNFRPAAGSRSIAAPQAVGFRRALAPTSRSEQGVPASAPPPGGTNFTSYKSFRKSQNTSTLGSVI